MTTIAEAQRQVKAWSMEKGWFDPERDADSALALIHSEISELIEEYRNGHPPQEVYYEDGKPEGIGPELVDTIIRVLDLAACYNQDLEVEVKTSLFLNGVIGDQPETSLNDMGILAGDGVSGVVRDSYTNIPRHANAVHYEISKAWEKVGKYRIGVLLAQIMIVLLDFGDQWDIDMDHLFDEKMAYNQTRSHRHGNKVI